jgi:hypothetical protein
MRRRLLRLGAILLLMALPALGCGGKGKEKDKAPKVPDPDGNFVPKPGGAKPG